MCNGCNVALPTDQFAERLLGILNGSGLAMMISIGHRTGLLDVMAQLPPASSNDIAVAAGLNERYVREWLGAMVTGQLMNYDPENRVYHLPEEHAAVLTRAAAPNNLAGVMQWVSVLASVEDKIIECFHEGGGLRYEDYGRFHPVMAEESGQTTVAALEDHIIPLVPDLADKLRQGIRVLDIGCGSGQALLRLAELFPRSAFVGYDICESAIRTAQANAFERSLLNIRFEKRNVAELEKKQAFDLVFAFDAIHDQAHPDVVLSKIGQALADDGLFLMQDIKASSALEKNVEHPLAPFIFTISCMHCMSVSLGQGGMGLGAAWGKEKALEMLTDAGFAQVDVHELSHDILNYYYIARAA